MGRELQAPWAIPSETLSHKQTEQESNTKCKPLGGLRGQRLTPCVGWQVGYLWYRMTHHTLTRGLPPTIVEGQYPFHGQHEWGTDLQFK